MHAAVHMWHVIDSLMLANKYTHRTKHRPHTVAISMRLCLHVVNGLWLSVCHDELMMSNSGHTMQHTSLLQQSTDVYCT